MALIKGITIILYEKAAAASPDPFGALIYTETVKEVQNVLVRPLSEDDAVDGSNLTGKKIEYELCIPKDNTDEWTNRKVSFFGQIFETVGKPVELIGSMVPLDWNKKIKVKAYE